LDARRISSNARETLYASSNSTIMPPGSVKACLTLMPPPVTPGELTCPTSQHAAVTEITYSDIQITDQTNQLSSFTPPRTITVTLVVCE